MVLAISAVWQEWLPVSVLVVMISLGIVSIIYAIAKALSDEQLIAWARSELYQAIGSMFFIGIAIVFLISMNLIILSTLESGGFECGPDSCSFKSVRMGPSATRASFDNVIVSRVTCGEGNPCHIAIAQSKLDSMYDIVRFYTAGKIVSYGILSIASKTLLDLQLVRVAPFAGLEMITQGYSVMFEILTSLLITLKAHSIFLTIIQGSLFPMFFIGGIILRSLSFMRGLGGLLIAISLGLFFVYPTLIILTTLVIAPNPDEFPIVFDDYTQFTELPGGVEKDLETELSSSINLNPQRAVSNEELAASGVHINSYLGVLRSVEVDGKKHDMIGYYLFNVVQPKGFIDNTAFLTVWVLIQTLIIIYATVIFIKNTSPFFGGDVDIAGLARLL